MRELLLVAYIISEFLLYILSYKIILCANLNKDRLRWISAVIGLIIFHGFIWLRYGEAMTKNLTIFSMVLIPILLLDKLLEVQNLILYPVIVVEASVITISFSFILAMITGIAESILKKDLFVSFLCQGCSILILVITDLVRRKNKTKIYEPKLEVRQIVIYYIVMIASFIMIASLQALSTGFPQNKYVSAIAVPLSIACVVLIVITIWQGILKNREQVLQEENKRKDEYMFLQKVYYEDMLSQDNKIREIRHDINAHMQAIQSYLENNENNELQQYLSNFVRETTTYENRKITGNNAIDAMLNPLFDKIETNNIITNLECVLPSKLPISEEYSLCTILSNLLTNAFEACLKVEKEKRRIDFKICKYNSQTIIRIKNTVDHTVEIHGNIISTTKKDKIHHGIGTKNIYDMVQKRKGIINYESSNNEFSVEIILP